MTVVSIEICHSVRIVIMVFIYLFILENTLFVGTVYCLGSNSKWSRKSK